MNADRRPYSRLRSRHRREDGKRALVAIALAPPLGLLLLALFTLLASAPEGGLKLSEPPTQVSMLQLPASQWAANRQLDQSSSRQASRSAPAAPVPEEEKRPEPPKPPERMPGQVVDVAPTPDTNPPADTHRVSEYNTHVDRETQSRDKTAFYKNAMPTHTTTEKPQKLAGKAQSDKVQAIGSPSLGKQKPAKQGKRQGQKVEIPDVKRREKLAVAPGKGGEVPEHAASEGVHGNSQRLRLQAGDGDEDSAEAGGNGGTGSHLNLIPSQSLLDKITGAPAPDHLEGVDEGEGTFLNTREWKFAGFFNRVKQSVAEHWDPSSAMRRRDPSGQIYGWRDRRTVLTVTLTKTGGIQEMSVEKSCGVDFLDEEAMQAFRRAQPFPNPPGPLVDENGQIKFSFGFYLDMSSGGLMRLFHSSPD